MNTKFSESSTLHVVKIFLTEVKTLMGESGTLLKLEMQGKIKEARQGIFQIFLGSLLGYVGLWIFLGSLILGIGVFIPLWMAAGLVAVCIVGSGGIFLYRGIQVIKHFDPKPENTVQALKEINHVFSRSF